MRNYESNNIYVIAMASLGALGTGVYILLNYRIKSAAVCNEKFAFGLIFASIVPLLISMDLIIGKTGTHPIFPNKPCFFPFL